MTGLPKEPAESIRLDEEWAGNPPDSDSPPQWPRHRRLPDFRAQERAFLRRLALLMLLSALYFALGWQRLQPEAVARWLGPDAVEMQQAGHEDCARYAADVSFDLMSASRDLRPAAGEGRAGLCAWRRELADMLGLASGAATSDITGVEVGAAAFPWSQVEVKLVRRSLARLPDGRLRRFTSAETLVVRNSLFGLEIGHVDARMRLDDEPPSRAS